MTACVPAAEAPTSPPPAEVVQPVRTAPAARPSPSRSAVFTFDGELEQGGWMRGTVPPGTVEARLGEERLAFDDEGRFFAAFDRDSPGTMTLAARLADGRTIESPLAIAPRGWDIEHVDVARSPGGASEAFMRRRQPELDAIWTARLKETGSEGWKQDFAWPVKGRISGRFGSQRVYRGEPGSYHSGLDIAPGNGAPYVAPADGVVVLVADDFSLEGKLLIIDHGQGLNSAFLHSSRLYVREGERVRQGQHIGDVGASGRATGPHLHWSLKWRNARLDPLLFTGPMR
ncbi:M23 family metallopeptidase [Qipengyuania qiaonensis]|uniref:M23 family metallopeptidase n=1 Tax=Qipengyuania qiaonensis TaxID=2867240 RepID=A0ABS7J4I6_9SPHN|nr:M23 family metallopeptidase [Qipengyuania qiaonensis]MBX7482181.1 M23 family metallopeptidase [Qipengyuania qiaonensis]